MGHLKYGLKDQNLKKGLDGNAENTCESNIIKIRQHLVKNEVLHKRSQIFLQIIGVLHQYVTNSNKKKIEKSRLVISG